MEQFSCQEYADIHFIYSFCSGNATESRREYNRRFLGRRIPEVQTFVRVHQCLAENGRFPSNIRLVSNFVQDVGVKEAILNSFDRDPRVSTRTVARELQVSQMFVSKILQREGLYPYHFTRVQTLEPRDPP